MRVVVLGGGVAGLSAAHYLRQLLPSCSVAVLERAPLVGGWISSTRHKDGAVYEHGPRTVRPVGEQGANTLQLVEQLSLQDSVKWVDKSHPAALNRQLCVDGRLHKLPSSLLSLLWPLAPFGLRPLALCALTDLLTPAPQPPLEDDSLYAFAERRFGERVARYAVDPLVRGVCAGDARQISVRLLMNELFEHERRHGGVLRGWWRERRRSTGGKRRPDGGALAERAIEERWAVWSLEGGLQTLTDRLAERLQTDDGVDIYTDTAAVKLQFDSSTTGGATVYTDSGSRMSADHVISALPAHALSTVLTADGDLRALLSRIESVTSAAINLEYRGADVIAEPGFGYLIPSCQPSAGVLGVTFDTCAFAQGDGRTVLTVMAGGADGERHLGTDPSDEFLVQLACDEVRRTLGVTRPPDRSCARLLRQCIPQYRVGHRALVQRIRRGVGERVWPLTLTGAAYDGISVNDCIMSAKKAAQTVVGVAEAVK